MARDESPHRRYDRLRLLATFACKLRVCHELFRNGWHIKINFHALKVEEGPLSLSMMQDWLEIFFSFSMHTTPLKIFQSCANSRCTSNCHFLFRGHVNPSKEVNCKEGLAENGKIVGCVSVTCQGIDNFCDFQPVTTLKIGLDRPKEYPEAAQEQHKIHTAPNHCWFIYGRKWICDPNTKYNQLHVRVVILNQNLRLQIGVAVWLLLWKKLFSSCFDWINDHWFGVVSHICVFVFCEFLVTTSWAIILRNPGEILHLRECNTT